MYRHTWPMCAHARTHTQRRQPLIPLGHLTLDTVLVKVTLTRIVCCWQTESNNVLYSQHCCSSTTAKIIICTQLGWYSWLPTFLHVQVFSQFPQKWRWRLGRKLSWVRIYTSNAFDVYMGLATSTTRQHHGYYLALTACWVVVTLQQRSITMDERTQKARGALMTHHQSLRGDLIIENILPAFRPLLTKVEYSRVDGKEDNVAKVDELIRILVTKEY